MMSIKFFLIIFAMSVSQYIC